jgi:hypothetical protein
VFPDTFEVRVFSEDPAGLRLVAGVELVSPRNKDRPDARRAFALKCGSYLVQSVNLIVLDAVTSRQANLHNEMMQLLAAPPAALLPADAGLYAVAYRPVLRNDRAEIDLWPALLAVGAALPLLPLGLTAELAVPLDLEATYTEACRRLRLP